MLSAKGCTALPDVRWTIEASSHSRCEEQMITRFPPLFEIAATSIFEGGPVRFSNAKSSVKFRYLCLQNTIHIENLVLRCSGVSVVLRLVASEAATGRLCPPTQAANANFTKCTRPRILHVRVKFFERPLESRGLFGLSSVPNCTILPVHAIW